MKKQIYIILALALFSLASCSKNPENKTQESVPQNNTTQTQNTATQAKVSDNEFAEIVKKSTARSKNNGATLAKIIPDELFGMKALPASCGSGSNFTSAMKEFPLPDKSSAISVMISDYGSLKAISNVDYYVNPPSEDRVERKFLNLDGGKGFKERDVKTGEEKIEMVTFDGLKVKIEAKKLPSNIEKLEDILAKINFTAIKSK